MPIRINPIQKLDPCVLTLDSIKEIVELTNRDFPHAFFSAVDGAWEIYDEHGVNFIQSISLREKLDTFVVKAFVVTAKEKKAAKGIRQLEIVFNATEAKVNCIADPIQENWFEHFIIDLKKCIFPPTFAQVMAHLYGQGTFDLRLALVAIPINPKAFLSTPYCKILIQQKPPNPFWENVKSSIVSNLIWAIIVFVSGIIITLVTQQILKK